LVQPGSGPRAELFLADSAQVAEGKLFVMGGGWQMTQAVPAATFIAIAGIIRIPWDDTNRQFPWMIELLDSNGASVMVPTPMGDQPYRIDGSFEGGRPAGVPRGTEFQAPFAMQVVRPPLMPGRYEYRVTVGNSPTHLPFDVLAPPGGPAQPA
jgi:hypothetical protein